ncbi:Chorismate mutase II [Prochlorococcus marinus str. MIT 9321]|uniref:chorismate mutase n=1 Tax=Prochlorococcus marinus str. MIT 9401 TaxID=167551 RepID=A0A0A2BBQ4_PROMR|nr:chorismate mutase [Prochlorococcus marinus]KGG02905.1 Chorismate mutase II [Prochlorococcus marinus str. MIT 9321]KGG05528.1 Chorismate mutase II [Prochlorococcus marinus str. MIT 9322]KGG10562.1 Chorismate mutase II [Prochlorococcus marinus str. MIT 9401]
MSEKIKDDYKMKFIRGATTASGNSVKEIEAAVVELIDELILRNNLNKTNLLSIIFTATKDLDACFPASIARKCNGLDSVAFLDCQQMYVNDDVDFCIRIMAQVLLPSNNTIKHPYLRGASKLRTDRC